MNKENVIITIPHSGPALYDPENAHPKDYRAEEAGLLMLEKLKNKWNIVLFMNKKIARRDCDLNRSFPCEDEGFRPELTKTFSNMNIKYLFDIHSYPSDYEENPLSKNDFYILYLESHSESKKMAKHIRRECKSKGIKCEISEGTNENSIILEANSHGITAILIEFSEGSIDLNFICENISNAIWSFEKRISFHLGKSIDSKQSWSILLQMDLKKERIISRNYDQDELFYCSHEFEIGKLLDFLVNEKIPEQEIFCPLCLKNKNKLEEGEERRLCYFSLFWIFRKNTRI